MAYIPHKPKPLETLQLGSTYSSQSSGLGDIVGDVVQGVAGQLLKGVSAAVDKEMDKFSEVIANGLDKFVDSPKGTVLFEKIGNKAESAILQVVSNQRTNLALLGVAGIAFVIGGTSVGSRVSPNKAKFAFGLGAAALAAIALGVGSPPPLPQVSSKKAAIDSAKKSASK